METRNHIKNGVEPESQTSRKQNKTHKKMKKTLLILVALALVFTMRVAQAQLINPGFETWSTDMLVPTAMNPNSGNGTTGWWDYNFFNSSLVGSSPISVTRCTDTVHTGSYSVRLQTKVYTPTSWNIYKSWGIPFIGHNYNDTLGILFDGNVNVTTTTFKPGIPCTQNLTQFKFYYQYKPTGNDTAECRVELVNHQTPVAGGSFKTGVATGISGWQQAVINFTYISGLTPDTLYILFSSSTLDYSPKASSILWIDDASVTLPTGIEQMLGEENSMEIFPNPACGEIQVQSLKFKVQSLEIYNIQGRLIKTLAASGSKTSVDISGLASGMYFVKAKTDKGIEVKKFVTE